jgi:hypothetical protein
LAVNALLHDFAEDRNLGETRANVVMQIGRNPSPHPFKLGKSFFPAAPQGLVGTLAFTDVADNPCEIAVAVAAEFAEGDLQWNLVTVPMQSRELDSLPGNVPLSCLLVTGKTSLMQMA